MARTNDKSSSPRSALGEHEKLEADESGSNSHAKTTPPAAQKVDEEDDDDDYPERFALEEHEK